VPLRSGIPGARILYQAPLGERVRLTFDAADPRLPYACPAHDQVAAGATVHGVARAGVDGVGYLSGTVAGGAVMLTVSPSATGTPGEVALPVLGGSPEVKIR
jgi:hypothetical protein